jgi:hypothetical protein
MFRGQLARISPSAAVNKVAALPEQRNGFVMETAFCDLALEQIGNRSSVMKNVACCWLTIL